MKRTVCLILAILMLCTFPALFASDDFDLPEHDHDHECELCEAGGDSLMAGWGYCPVCQIITYQDAIPYSEDVYVDAGDGGHWVYTNGHIDCLECGATLFEPVLIGEAWEAHVFDTLVSEEGVYPPEWACVCGARAIGK